MIGTRLGNRYEVLRELGRGGMGVVYLARDPVLDRDVAAKLIPPRLLNPDADERFRREARLVARLDHPGIVSVHDFGMQDDALFYIMPFVAGRDLRAVLREETLTLGEILEIGRQVAEALDYSHAAGVIHRDIKPENVMIVREADGSLRARLTDFGLAVGNRDRRLTASGMVVGTLDYLAPEQLQCEEIDATTDVYALGTLLYEMLTGATPFSGDVALLLYLIVNTTPQRPSEVGVAIPPEVEAVVMQCLERDRQRRPASAGRVAAALAACIESLHDSDAFSKPHRTTSLRPTARRTTQLMGREKELTLLLDCLTASTTEASLVLIGGAAGIGKTRLLDEVSGIASARRIPILRSAVAGLEQSLPYGALCRVIEEYFRLHLQADLSDLAPELVQRFPLLMEIPELRAHARAASALSADRLAVFDLLARTFIRMAAAQPLMIVIEDLHMADITAEALQHISARLTTVPVFLVGTYRSDEIDRGHPMVQLLETVRKSRHGTVLELGPLTLEAHRRLVATLVGSERVDDEVVVRTFEATEGNPHFATELVRSLLESHELTQSGSGSWHLASDAAISAESLPATIQQAVERRLERLSERHRSVLSAASVVGRTFDAEELSAVMGEPSAVLDADLDDLLSAGYLKEDRHARGDRLAFTSRVVCDVLYAAVPRRRRRALHRALADYLERRHAAHLERMHPHLLHHYRHGDVPEKVIEYGMLVARASLANFGARDAVSAARVVLEFLEDDGLPRAEARELLGSALHMAGRTDEALQELDSAVRLYDRIGETARACAAASAAAEMAWQRQKINETRRWVEKALALARRGGDEAHVHPLLSLGAAAANLRGDGDAARRYLEESERLRPSQAAMRAAERYGTLSVAFSYSVETIDPSSATYTWEGEIATLMFDTLTGVDESARTVPRLAESFALEDDARRLRIRLREGVQFHDGRSLTATDVRYTLERFIRRRPPRRQLIDGIVGADRVLEGTAGELEGVHILSPHELVIELVRPLPSFPAALSYPALAILPAGTEELGADWRSGFVGTGPFRLVRFVPGRRLEVEANPLYWRDGLPHVERLLFSFNVPAEQIASGFRNGRYSLAPDLTPEEHEHLRRDRELGSHYAATPTLSTCFLAFNTNRGPLRDRALREQIRSALAGVPALVDRLGSLAIPAARLFPPGVTGYEAPAPPRDERRSGTRPLLREPLTAVLFSIFATSFSGFARDVIAAIEGAGIHTRFEAPRDKLLGNNLEFDLYFGRYYCDYPDCDGFAYQLLHSQSGMLGGICGSPRIDRLVEAGRVETDPQLRDEIYRELETLVMDEVLLVPLFHQQACCFARPEVESFGVRRFFPTIPYEQLSVRRTR